MSIWDYESTVSRQWARSSGKGWTTRGVFVGVPKSQVKDLVPPEWSPLPGQAGSFAEVLIGSKVEADWRVRVGDNYARVTLYYRPMTFLEWLEAHPNKGVLICRSAVMSQRVHSVPAAAQAATTTLTVGNWSLSLPLYTNGFDPTWGNLFGGINAGSSMIMLDGQDPTSPEGVLFWRITQGSPIKFMGRTVYEVFAVIDNPDVYFYQFASKVGCYNTIEMGAFPLAPETSRTGQWLLIGLSCAPRYAAKRLFTYRARFALNNEGLGWAEPTISRQFEVKSYVVEQKDKATGLVIGKRSVRTLIPTGKQNTVHLIQPANFTPINAMLINSWGRPT